MKTYYLEMRDEGISESVEIEAETLQEAEESVPDEANDWCEGGDWGDDGAEINVWWTMYEDEDHTTELADGACTVEIAPNHNALIDAAGGDVDCEHEWSSEGEGGCDENPGVWSAGGTAMMFVAHCTKCGLRRTEHHTGSQCNPGEHDTVEYVQPVEDD